MIRWHCEAPAVAARNCGRPKYRQMSTPDNIMDYVQPVATGGAEGGGAEGAGWWKMPLLVAALVIVLLAIILYVARDVLPERLASKGWVLYVMEGCGACMKQREILGPYGYHVPLYPFTGKGEYLGDTKMVPPVPVQDIKGFPTWVNTKTQPPFLRKIGVQSEAELVKMAG
jgi:hypothetical protein